MRVVCLIVAITMYVVLGLGTLGIGLIYFGLMALAAYVMLGVVIARVRTNGIEVGPEQLPRVYESACRAARALGLRDPPTVYVAEEGGMLNAFATKYAARGWVVVYADLVEACGEDEGLLDVVMAHEIGHLVLRHITWRWIMLPAMAVPLLFHAYSRACEYSADRCAMAGAARPEQAMRAMLVLAAGGKYARMASLEAFLHQDRVARGFWQTVMGWFSTHPWLTRRVEALHLLGHRPAVPAA